MVASHAVDGNTDGDYYENSCTHTTQGTRDPAWWVDLGQSYTIGRYEQDWLTIIFISMNVYLSW